MPRDFFPSPVPDRSAQFIVLAAGGTDGPEQKGNETEERLTRIEQAMVTRDKNSLPLLRKWVTWDGDERVRERSIGALTLIGDAGSSRLFLDRLSRDPSPRVRRAAAEAIGILSFSGTTSQVAKILGKDKDPYVRAECARALGRIKGRGSKTALMVSLVKDPSPEVRALSADALSNLRIPESPELLRVVAQKDSSTLVRIYAVRALIVIDPAKSVPVFQSVWEGSTDPDLRVAAYRGLLLSRRSGDWESVGLADIDERIRFLAFRSWLSHAIPSRPGAGLTRNTEPVAKLQAFLKDPVRGIRELAKNALERQGFVVRPDGFGYATEK
jgi:HEAT repeat protein